MTRVRRNLVGLICGVFLGLPVTAAVAQATDFTGTITTWETSSYINKCYNIWARGTVPSDKSGFALDYDGLTSKQVRSRIYGCQPSNPPANFADTEVAPTGTSGFGIGIPYNPSGDCSKNHAWEIDNHAIYNGFETAFHDATVNFTTP
jgi:hypothetical protein